MLRNMRVCELDIRVCLRSPQRPHSTTSAPWSPFLFLHLLFLSRTDPAPKRVAGLHQVPFSLDGKLEGGRQFDSPDPSIALHVTSPDASVALTI
ncbi:hypothetical protein AOLI_G00165390 [Acnodon oligacanthus]